MYSIVENQSRLIREVKMGEDSPVRSHLRTIIALFGMGDLLAADEVTCCFELQLKDGTKRLVCAKEEYILGNVRNRLIEMGGDCGEIKPPPAAKGKGYGTSQLSGWYYFDNAHDGLNCEYLKWAVINGEYRHMRQICFSMEEFRAEMNRGPLPHRLDRYGGPVPPPPPRPKDWLFPY